MLTETEHWHYWQSIYYIEKGGFTLNVDCLTLVKSPIQITADLLWHIYRLGEWPKNPSRAYKKVRGRCDTLSAFCMTVSVFKFSCKIQLCEEWVSEIVVVASVKNLSEYKKRTSGSGKCVLGTTR